MEYILRGIALLLWVCCAWTYVGDVRLERANRKFWRNWEPGLSSFLPNGDVFIWSLCGAAMWAVPYFAK